MKAQFEFKEGTITVDLDRNLVRDLHDLLDTGFLQHGAVLRTLQQVEYFNDRRDEILSNYGEHTIVICQEKVVFDGSPEAAFEWVENHPDVSDIYIVEAATSGTPEFEALGEL